jgi:hypothetical protein
MRRIRPRFIAAGLTVTLSILVCFQFSFAQSGSVTLQWGEPGKAEHPEGYKKSGKKGGPPLHAPAHGYRAKYQYRYYPCCNSYYDAGRGVWFYLRGGDWAVGASIPTDLKAQLGPYVNISMDTDKPYEFAGEHKKDYPAEKYRKK